MILAEATLEAGYERAVKVQVASMQVHHRGETLAQVTVSIGVAAFP